MTRLPAVSAIALFALLALSACKPTHDTGSADATPSPATDASTAAKPVPDATANDQPPPDSAAGDNSALPAVSGPEIPTLSIRTVDGKAFDLSAHRGKWVVVNFWATWCAPCRKEMPELSALDAMRENIDVIGLAYEDIDPADMGAFLVKHPVVYPIAILDTMAPPADFAAPRGLPMTYLIAPDGKVARKFLGPVTATEIERVIGGA